MDDYYKEDRMSASQFKDFLKCEKCALAKYRGEYVEEKTSALMMGSYIDAYFSGEMEQFKKDNPEIFNSKTGALKSDYVKCEEIIKVIEKDEVLMKHLSGEHQVKVYGTIAGVPFKGKIDSYFPGKCIVDQKIMKDLEPVWDEKSRSKKNIVDYWGYTIQGAIYRELVRQTTGYTLPFLLAITTKEKTPRKALLEIDSKDLDAALELVERLAPRFQAIKEGKIQPTSCHNCDYCVSTTMLTGSFSYHILDPDYQKDEIEY